MIHPSKRAPKSYSNSRRPCISRHPGNTRLSDNSDYRLRNIYRGRIESSSQRRGSRRFQSRIDIPWRKLAHAQMQYSIG
jgi:hypothetical protein